MRVFLSRAEEQTLWELRKATTVTQRVNDRAEVIRLSAQGWYVDTILTEEKYRWTTGLLLSLFLPFVRCCNKHSS